MKKSIKRLMLFVLTFLLASTVSINVFAETFKSASNLFYADSNIEEKFDSKADVCDVYAAGNYIDLSGEVSGDIIAAGSTINVNLQNIDGNIRAAGANININSKVAKNITVAGSKIKIESDSYAKGIYVFGQEVTFDGTADDVYINGETVEVNGIISGNLNVNCNELILGKDAKIDGTIKVESPKMPTILGDIDSSKVNFVQKVEKENSNFDFSAHTIASKILSIITAIIIVSLLTLLCNNFISKSSKRMITKAWMPFLIGFATLIILPITAIILCITIVGIPVSILALIIYGVLIYLAPAVSGAIAGRSIFRNMNVYLSAILCTVIIKVIMIIPYIGGVLMFACILLSLGAFAENIFGIISKKEA